MVVLVAWLLVLPNDIQRLERRLHSFLGWRIIPLQQLLLLLVSLVRGEIGSLRRLLGQVALFILQLEVQVDLVLLASVPE